MEADRQSLACSTEKHDSMHPAQSQKCKSAGVSDNKSQLLLSSKMEQVMCVRVCRQGSRGTSALPTGGTEISGMWPATCAKIVQDASFTWHVICSAVHAHCTEVSAACGCQHSSR